VRRKPGDEALINAGLINYAEGTSIIAVEGSSENCIGTER
jgi:hypothetical protein